MKLSEIIELSKTLSKIVTLDMPFSLSYKFNKLIKIVSASEEFYNTKVYELLQTYGKKDDNGKIIQDELGVHLRFETQDEFHKKHAELRDVEISDELLTFTVSELESLSISPQDLLPLMPLIKD